MCRQEPCARMSSAVEADDIEAAEESLSVYCKPVEFYNILQRRAIRNPLFLQRCLGYKIEAKHKKRIQMTVSLSRAEIDGELTRNLFPLYVFLARLVSDSSSTECASVYRFTRACMLTRPNEVVERGQVQANFILPDMNKLTSELNSGSICVLLVSFVGAQNALGGIKLSNGPLDVSSFPKKHGGFCLWGKIPMEALHMSWDNSPNFKLGQRSEMMSSLDLRSCFLKLSCSDKEKYISIDVPYNLETVSNFQQVQVIVSAEEFGAREKSPYSSSYVCNDVPSSSLSRIIRLRAGNVIFNYRYYNNKLQRTEVTEDFSCAFCLVKCASFKGLRCHLTSSHDLFNFEFWVTEEYQAVNVSVKNEDIRSQIIADKIDPKKQVFAFSSKPLKRKRQKCVQRSAKPVHSSAPESNLRVGLYEQSSKTDGVIPQIYGDPACFQSSPGNSLAPPAMLQFAKTRKISMERSDARNCTLLRKRQFFHSHRSQLMALEQVLSDRDSEDEVDDDVADLEDRRMLDDFVDVTKDEKQIMHMWNSFVRKQRVLADNHVPWACEAFSKLHGPDLVQSPSLIWRWRLFLIKLWNHGLLDPRTMNNCNVILEKCQNKASDPTAE